MVLPQRAHARNKLVIVHCRDPGAPALCVETKTPAGYAQAGASSFLPWQSFTNGNYLLALQIEGKGPGHRINLECKAGKLKCVNSDEPRLADWHGQSTHIGNGVFMVFLAGESVRATQLWVFRADGSATVKEVPDRGEKQSAVPINGTGLK